MIDSLIHVSFHPSNHSFIHYFIHSSLFELFFLLCPSLLLPSYPPPVERRIALVQAPTEAASIPQSTDYVRWSKILVSELYASIPAIRFRIIVQMMVVTRDKGRSKSISSVCRNSSPGDVSSFTRIPLNGRNQNPEGGKEEEKGRWPPKNPGRSRVDSWNVATMPGPGRISFSITAENGAEVSAVVQKTRSGSSGGRIASVR